MFSRLELLIGESALKRLEAKKVVVLGLGGVGSYALEALARSGIGTIIIVDKDKIELSNLNRQLMTNQNNIGEFKVDVLESRLHAINPHLQIFKIKEFITPENLDMIFQYEPDFIVDAIDSLKTKKALIKTCLQRKVKLIVATGMGNRKDATKVQITTLSKTYNDKIAKELRFFMKHEHLNGKVPVVFSSEVPLKVKGSIASTAFVPACAGILMASYVVNEFLKESE